MVISFARLLLSRNLGIGPLRGDPIPGMFLEFFRPGLKREPELS
jgi:hypothetical protein